MPRTILQGQNLITNPYDIANIFINYFSSLADAAKEETKDSRKRSSDYLNCNGSIFIQLTASEEVANIISALSMNKSSGPNNLKEETFAIKCFRKFRENKLLNIKF